MVDATTPSNRQRKRPRSDSHDNSNTQTPMASAKRRRVDQLAAEGADSPSTPKTLSAIAAAMTSVFSIGGRNSGGTAVREAQKEVVGTTSTFQLDSSPAKASPSRGRKRTLLAHRGGRAKASAPKPGDGTETGKDQDAPSSASKRPSGRKPGRPKGVVPNGADAGATPTGTPLSGRRGSRLDATIDNLVTTDADTDNDLAASAAGQETPSRSTGRKRRPAAVIVDDTVNENDEPTSAGTPTKKEPDSATRTRTPSRRLVDTLKEQQAGSPSLRGILTPSRRGGIRNPNSTRKTVTFGSREKKSLADAPLSTGKRGRPKGTPKGTPKKLDDAITASEASGDQKEEDEDEDDEVCAVCSKPDSKPPNQILFCDGCNKAVHQKCYGVDKIPKGDWLCHECTTQQDGTAKTSAAASIAQAIPNLETHLCWMRRVLLDRCTGRTRLKMVGQDDAYTNTRKLIEQTVLAGEGNSMMVIGPRGSGKTTLVEDIISQLRRNHREHFHVVRLNGFIHTDDKLALREIWRQLGKEMAVEDESMGRTNYADTMASLLALLSHPEEILGEAHQGATSQSIVFVIDEFDMFATHSRQTLLYNLFDIAQSRKAPITVLGLTTRLDVVEMLEKRVKSRFSHRYVYLSPPKSLSSFWDICKQGLIIDQDWDDEENYPVQEHEGLHEFKAFWRDHMDKLHAQVQFQRLLQMHYYTTKSVPGFLSAWIVPLSQVSPAAPTLGPPTASASLLMPPPDPKLHLLPSLSDLDLVLLIAAARLDIIAHTDTVNLAMAYDEYVSLMSRQRAQTSPSGFGGKLWGRPVAGQAWERLIDMGLLLPSGVGAASGGAGGSRGAAAATEGKMWRIGLTLEEIPTGVKLTGPLAKWCKEI